MVKGTRLPKQPPAEHVHEVSNGTVCSVKPECPLHTSAFHMPLWSLGNLCCEQLGGVLLCLLLFWADLLFFPQPSPSSPWLLQWRHPWMSNLAALTKPPGVPAGPHRHCSWVREWSLFCNSYQVLLTPTPYLPFSKRRH